MAISEVFIPNLHISKWRILKIGLFQESLGEQIQKIPRKLNGRKLKPFLNISHEISWSDSLRTAGSFGTFVSRPAEVALEKNNHFICKERF